MCGWIIPGHLSPPPSADSHRTTRSPDPRHTHIAALLPLARNAAALLFAACTPRADSCVRGVVPCVRTNNHIYAQVVNDVEGHILAAASTLDKDDKMEYGGNCDAAAVVGKKIAERAKAKGIEKVHFDRNGKKFHGRVKALADSAREAGLVF